MEKRKLRLMFLITIIIVFLATIGLGMSSPDTTIAVDPQEVNDLEPGENFTVDINVADIVISDTPPISYGLYGWSVNMTFDPNILNCTSVEEGPFLSQVAETVPLLNIDNTIGYAFIGGIYNPPLPDQGAAGSGVLATVTFTVVGQGETALKLELAKLRTVIAGQNVVIENVIVIDGNFRNAAAPLTVSTEFIVVIIVGIIIGGSVAVLLYRRRGR